MQGPTSYRLDRLTPWPIKRSHDVILSSSQKSQALEVADRLRLEDNDLTLPRSETQMVTSGWQAAPTLYLEDHRGVDLVSEQSAKVFEYRMLGLADEGDAYLLSGRSDGLFETYIQNSVRSAAPTIINLQIGDNSDGRGLAAACADTAEALEAVLKITRKAGGLNIAPFQVTEDVWALAHKIESLSQCPVKVVGPNPTLSSRANDKLWFTHLATLLLGKDAVPITFSTFCLASTAAKVIELSQRHSKIIMKIPTSAGGLGNITLRSEEIRDMSHKVVYEFLSKRLEAKDWVTGNALLVGVWDDHVIGSPSVQLWIPEAEAGTPIIEGVFEQVVKGAAGVFVGAKRASLDSAILSVITSEAMRIAQVMQYLGYYGRLSLDTVLMKRPDGEMKVHWIETNARWGGVSIPMTIGNRIIDQDTPVSVLVLQRRREKGEDTLLRQTLSKMNVEELSSPVNAKRGFVQLLPSSGPLQLIVAYGLDDAEIMTISKI